MCCRDIDGTHVKVSDTPGDVFPFQRALAWQAAGAIDLAKERKVLPEGFEETIDLKVCFGLLHSCEMDQGDFTFDTLSSDLMASDLKSFERLCDMLQHRITSQDSELFDYKLPLTK